MPPPPWEDEEDSSDEPLESGRRDPPPLLLLPMGIPPMLMLLGVAELKFMGRLRPAMPPPLLLLSPIGGTYYSGGEVVVGVGGAEEGSCGFLSSEPIKSVDDEDAAHKMSTNEFSQFPRQSITADRSEVDEEGGTGDTKGRGVVGLRVEKEQARRLWWSSRDHAIVTAARCDVIVTACQSIKIT
jgi:hypothetical protein